ncbi:MAG TPA: alpha-amylase/4-alpha-glucanotransferase domain-containing protein [Ktedonobacteraceae bacterium]|nr:alpha-amylase/4-alpha-glucanotransferase domain-containing protein [Ktedonobacteraceae bacterium]
MISGRTKSIQLGLLLHNHQPVGNFPWVFQQVYEESYLPMIEALERHRGIRLSLHYTGSLLDWMEETHPEFLTRVAALVERKQIEMVSGGYYEPILPSIPDLDKIAQIRRLTERVERDFGTRPTGIWIAERVWEPGLPRLLREAGIEWTILDDVHFKNVGLEDSDLYGYYATEDQSTIVKVYATSKALRYTIPWRPVHETIETLRSLATAEGSRILVMGDDGEKFGSWPETGPYCWGSNGHNGWVDEFFSALEQNSDWLRMTPLGAYARSYPALGRIYIPTSSYIEMTEWALPPQKSYQFGKLLHQLEDAKRDDILQFMRGGFWRNFLVRYPEVNNQHKKMLRVHDAVYAACPVSSPAAEEFPGLVHLWKAQANDTYWHGLFGGIYMGHARSAIYHHLIKAENAADALRFGPGPWQRFEFTDFDRDSQEELLIESDQQNLYIDPQRGGTLFEWDMRRSMHNLLSVMTRHQESYHQTLREFEQERRKQEARGQEQQTQRMGIPAEQSGSEPGSPHTTVRTKEPGLDRYLVVDRYRRNSLIDHFFAPGTALEHFAQMRFEEQGNFVEAPYHTEAQQDEQGITVTMTRDGVVKRPGALGPLPVRVSKKLFVPVGEERLFITYTVQNRGQSRLQTRFASEWNIHLLGGGSNEEAYYLVKDHDLENGHFDSTGEMTEVRELHIGNRWIQQDVGFTLSEPATLWRFSIETVTGSEAGFERNHQGSSLTLLWPLLLDAGESWSVEIACSGSAPLTTTRP